MEPITGTVSITLEPVTIAPAAPPHTYFGVAQSLMPGVKILAAASPPPALALALLCSHVLECLLKAYLSRDGSDAALKEPNIRHDLNALWALAFAQGLCVQESPPAWADCLSGLHKSPYYLRYSTGVHGIVSPGAEPMTSGWRPSLRSCGDNLGNARARRNYDDAQPSDAADRFEAVR